MPASRDLTSGHSTLGEPYRCSPTNPCDEVSDFHIDMWGECFSLKCPTDTGQPADGD